MKIELEHIRMEYNGYTVFDDFSMAVEPQEFVTMIGGSGCGKTTILKLINGLLRPISGSIKINGQEIQTLNQVQMRRKIGYVIQDVGLFPHMNVQKNIQYVLDLEHSIPKEQRIERVKEIAESMELEAGLLNRYPGELSGGQKQRVGIARALAAKPEILLMDEPFGAVDDITRRKLQKEILRVHKTLQVTIVFVTHDVREACTLGTKMAILDEGKMVQYAEPSTIIKNPKVPMVEQLLERIKI